MFGWDFSNRTINCPKCRSTNISHTVSYLSHTTEESYEYNNEEKQFIAVNTKILPYKERCIEDDIYGYKCAECGFKSDEIGSFIVGHRFYGM